MTTAHKTFANLEDKVGVDAAYVLAQVKHLTLKRKVDGAAEVSQGMIDALNMRLNDIQAETEGFVRRQRIIRFRQALNDHCDTLLDLMPQDSLHDKVEEAYAEVVRLSDLKFNPKVRENRLRRQAKRRGLRIEKSRRRDQSALDYGMYALYDERREQYIHSRGNSKYIYTLEHIEIYFKHTPVQPQRDNAVIEKVEPTCWELIDLLNQWLDGVAWNQGLNDLLIAKMSDVSDAIDLDPYKVQDDAP